MKYNEAIGLINNNQEQIFPNENYYGAWCTPNTTLFSKVENLANLAIEKTRQATKNEIGTHTSVELEVYEGRKYRLNFQMLIIENKKDERNGWVWLEQLVNGVWVYLNPYIGHTQMTDEMGIETEDS